MITRAGEAGLARRDETVLETGWPPLASRDLNWVGWPPSWVEED
jgi:hypothetical protein